MSVTGIRKRQMQAVGPINHFGVEGEAVDRHAGEDVEGGLPGEELQPALGVGHLPRNKRFHHGLKNMGGQLAGPMAGAR